MPEHEWDDELFRAACESADSVKPLGALPQPSAFLVSDDASYVNGQAYAVDGGLSSTHPFTRRPA